MGDLDVKAELRSIYNEAALGRAEAFEFLCLWHEWCHQIDDFIDERQHRVCAIDLCADAAVLFANPFFRDQSATLLPLVAVVAEKYRSSVVHPRIDPWRISGNDMVLAVAALCGGRELVRRISRRLWIVVIKTQLGG